MAQAFLKSESRWFTRAKGVVIRFSLAFVRRDGVVAVNSSTLGEWVNPEIDQCPTCQPLRRECMASTRPQKISCNQRIQLKDTFLEVGKLIRICIESSEKKEILNAVETLTVCRH
jgi:hypothetical protein